MKKINYLYKNNKTLVGITTDYDVVEFKVGDKFKYKGHTYRVGHEGNYMAYIPIWRKFIITGMLYELTHRDEKYYDY
jgi:hypothetical protein